MGRGCGGCKDGRQNARPEPLAGPTWPGMPRHRIQTCAFKQVRWTTSCLHRTTLTFSFIVMGLLDAASWARVREGEETTQAVELLCKRRARAPMASLQGIWPCWTDSYVTPERFRRANRGILNVGACRGASALAEANSLHRWTPCRVARGHSCRCRRHWALILAQIILACQPVRVILALVGTRAGAEVWRRTGVLAQKQATRC